MKSQIKKVRDAAQHDYVVSDLVSGTLPKPYDINLVNNTFTIDFGIYRTNPRVWTSGIYIILLKYVGKKGIEL